MRVSCNFFYLMKPFFLRIFAIAFLLGSLNFADDPAPVFADGTECHTSGPVSGAYSVTVCLAAPLDNALVSGDTSVTATVSVTGTNPGVQKLIFYLGGEYLLTDYSSPYTFVLPTTKFVDGARSLEVEAVLRDGLTYGRGAIQVTFDNGITEPPANTNTYAPSSGTTPAAGRPFLMVATGDGASGEPNAIAVTNLIDGMDPNLFLYLGDVYNDGTETEFHNWYGTGSNHYSRFRSITNPTIGNHEYQGLQAPDYFDYWDNIPHYYSFDAAGWHFINLDSTSQYNQTVAGTPQYDWLVTDLEANTAVCTVAYFHHPLFNVGAEGESPRLNDIWALLAQHGVDVVLTGHDHDYQRWHPMNGAGELDPNGVTEFVVGTGGHGIQDFIKTDDRMAVGFNTPPTAFGALKMELNQDGAAFQFVNIQGHILDSGSIPCSGAPSDVTPPNAPANLTAASISSSHIDLTWTSSTDNVGVTGYQIYRDGALLDTIGALTSYADNMVTGNVTYQYHVRAIDDSGNISEPSNVAPATTPLLFSDDFESGDMSNWTFTTGLNIQSQDVYNGTYAAQGVSTGTATWAYKTLDAGQNDIYYRLRFKINSLGSNTYLMRFRTVTSTSLLGVYVTNTGKLAYRNDVTGAPAISSTTVTSGVWHALQVRVLINGTESQTEVWLDGVRIDELSKTESLGTTPVRRVQIGENSTGRTYDILFDNVTVHTSLINMTPPEVTLSEPLDNAIVREDVAVSAAVSDDVGIDQVEFFANGMLIGADYTEPYSLIWDSTAVGDGSVTLTARAVDIAFNTTISSGHTVKVDNAAPNVTIDSGPSGTVNGSAATFTFSSNEPSTYVCFIDDEEIEGCASPQAFDNLADGSHTFQVTATDVAGNNDPTPAIRTWIVDTTAPPVDEIHVSIGGVDRGSYILEQGQSLRQSYPGINAGPVKIHNPSVTPVIAAERLIYKAAGGVNTSFSEMMGLPDSQLDTLYWLPWYNNVDLDTQLRFANVTSATATVHVWVGGSEMPGSPFTLAAGESTRKSFPGINSGPVKILSDHGVPIVAAERLIYRVNGVNASFTEMMALPNSQLDTTFWLPWYNNVDLDTQLRIANVTTSPTTVHVFIGGDEMQGSPFTLAAGESTRKSFPGINDGPVKIVSDHGVPIVAAERLIYRVNGKNTSFSEMMALPNSQLDVAYWLPWYNNADLDTQLRFANTTNSTATVHIYIGGTEMQGSPFTLLPGESTRQSFTNINNGPVQIVSDVPIVAAERLIYRVSGVNTSFTEMMALPNSELDVAYWFPWYNNVDLDTQLRFGVP